MKVTEKVIRQNVMRANAHSKHTGLGIKCESGATGYDVKIVQRTNGFVSASFENLSAKEANVAALMFVNVACLTKPIEEA
jgi:hypothetical protein